MTNTYFVTGTDTEVGKTIASCALLQAAGQLGLRTVGYKPVASGSEMTAEGLRNSDALALQRNSVVAVDYAAINPYTFAEPTSPHIISADEEQLPVILVVGVKLGCINHAILTAQAVQQAGLTLAGWVANDVLPPGKRHAEYMATLKRALAAPLLGEIPWLAEEPERASTGRYIDLSVLSLASTSR